MGRVALYRGGRFGQPGHHGEAPSCVLACSGSSGHSAGMGAEPKLGRLRPATVLSAAAQVRASSRVAVSDRDAPRFTARSDAPMLSTLAEDAVEVAGEVALNAAADLPVGFAFGPAAFGVGPGWRVAAHAADGNGVPGAVELAVAEAVEPVPVGAAGGDRDGGGPPTASRRAASLRMRPAWDHDSRICAAVSVPGPYSAATRPGACPQRSR
jgi:hypothetical protein